MTFRLDYSGDLPKVKDIHGVTVDPAAPEKSFAVGLAQNLVTSFSGDVDLRPYCTPSQQWQLSSCAGNATADSVEVLNAIEEEAKAAAEGRAPGPHIELSRLFVYNLARNLVDLDQDGYSDLNKDAGTYISLCFEVLARYGICSEQVWPYDQTKVFTLPSLAAMRQAIGHRIHGYYRIDGRGQQRLDQVRLALRAKHPVVFGALIEKPFESHTGFGVVSRPRGATIGGHAMVIVGLRGKDFIVKNSWGADWGERGFWLMSEDYLAWDGVGDLQVPTKGSSF